MEYIMIKGKMKREVMLSVLDNIVEEELKHLSLYDIFRLRNKLCIQYPRTINDLIDADLFLQ
jgi:predicted SprT family Zn-dependent metalloprotease